MVPEYIIESIQAFMSEHEIGPHTFLFFVLICAALEFAAVTHVFVGINDLSLVERWRDARCLAQKGDPERAEEVQKRASKYARRIVVALALGWAGGMLYGSLWRAVRGAFSAGGSLMSDAFVAPVKQTVQRRIRAREVESLPEVGMLSLPEEKRLSIRRGRRKPNDVDSQ